MTSAISDGADDGDGTDGGGKSKANKKQGGFVCWLCLVTSVASVSSGG